MPTRSRFLFSATLVSAMLLVLSGAAYSLLSATEGVAATAQCEDGFDNDSDGRTDYPNDPDCSSSGDNDEHGGTSAVLLSVSDGKDRVAPGGSVLYVVTVSTNDNFSQTTNVELALASEISISSASNGGAVSGQSVRWNAVSVSRGNPQTFTVQGTVASTAPVGSTLIATARAGGMQTNDSTLVLSNGGANSQPDFDIDISDGESSVLPDDDMEYVIHVQNMDTIPVTADVRVTLSPFLAFVEPEDETDFDSSRILWQGQRFAPNEERTYRFSARAIERSNRDVVVRVSASVPGAVDTDNTTIRSAITPHDLSIAISDNRGQAAVGEILTYDVTLTNHESGTVSDAFVSAALPIYAEIVSVNDGGIADASNVRWRSLDIAGDSSRTVSFTARVRNDAPLGTELLSSAAVDGITDFDRTTVVSLQTVRSSSSRSSARSSRVSSRVSVLPPAPVPTNTATVRNQNTAVTNRTFVAQTTTQRPSQSVLLQKSADKKEVLPGGTVRFRIIVNNITSNTLSNLTLNDRFNASQFSVVDAGSATSKSDGSLEWSVPQLKPGDTWSATYVLKANATLASGTVISNLAALNGDGLDAIALDRRLSATKVSVVSSLPATGAPMDALGMLFIGGLALVPALSQRKLSR